MHAILLAGIALVGLPVLLHLILRQEPKRLPFPALRFLRQKQRQNQRKMRLRHVLLLTLRMLLLALFCLTLYQPTILGSQSPFDLGGEQPVAAVFVFDTSPSMSYRAADRTRLDDARRRALDLLAEFPDGSRVAVVDPVNPAGSWERSLADARRRVEELKEPTGAAVPVTAGLVTAYQLLAGVDAESDAANPLPRLVAVFSDRAAACWDAGRADELTRLKQAVPPPAVSELFVDVGADQPVNVAVTAAVVNPQVVPGGQPVTLTATVQSAGANVADAVVRCRVDGAATPERKSTAAPAGTPQVVTFTLRDLKPGWHQAEVSLETPDALPADNVRFVTFRVAEPRKVLTVCDDPDDALFWTLALQAKGEFDPAVRKPAEVEPAAFDLGEYEAVVLLAVADPTPLWAKLGDYVGRGGKLLIAPGPPEKFAPAAYDPGANPKVAALLPGKLAEVIDVSAARPAGSEWVVDDAAIRHPLLAPFREWRLRGNVDFIRNPRRVWKYWRAEAPKSAAVVAYNFPDAPADRHPAVLEKAVGKAGKVLLLTTRLDTPPAEPGLRWNNYWDTSESSWPVVFPNLLLGYLAGNAADANFQHPTGQGLTLPLPKGESGKPRKLVLEGPGVTGRDAFPEADDAQTELRLPPERTLTAGNYVLRTEDGKWREGFSLNPPADESNLDKVPEEAIAAVLGPDRVIPATKDLTFRDRLDATFEQPVELFPWLLIGVLLLFAAEGLLANRFYRAAPNPAAG